MTDKTPEIRWVGELRRVDVKPGDKFVLMIDEVISNQQAKFLQDQWAQFIGTDKIPILVLQNGMKIGVFGDAAESTQ